MGLFDVFGHKEPVAPPPSDGQTAGRPADAGAAAHEVFDLLNDDGRLVRYTSDDFDEIWATTDGREAGRHVSIGWLLLDEVTAAPGDDGPGLLERAFASGIGEGVGWDRRRGDGVDLRIGPGRPVVADDGVPEGVTTYILGYLKPGRHGSPLP